MLGSMSAFTINDAFMKALSDELSVHQAVLIRSVVVIILLAGLAKAQGAFRVEIARGDRGLMLFRTLAEVGAAFFFITALFNMPIANVTAIIQALPLTVTLAGAVFLGEAVGWRRISAIIVGLIGVLLIVRPGGDGFTIYSVYALLAVVCVTLRDLAARKMTRSVPTIRVALHAVIGVALFMAALSIGRDWAPVSQKAGLQLAGASFFVIGGYIFSVATMRVGEIGFVAPFRYSSLLVALILGYLIFGDWPDTLMLIGSAIIVAAGLFTFYRTSKLKT